jgi:hypothetical protein
MGVSVGTIVTRYDPHTLDRSCEDGTCVGKIVEIDSFGAHPDNPAVTVIWWETCQWHQAPTNEPYRYLLDETWQIGQMPTN